MKRNAELIKLALLIIIIFGGTFAISYWKTGEILLDQIIGISIGVILLVVALIWRQFNKSS
ncbi:hypothetical protein BAMA_05740 [Bacillus manliponensis]|uniref:Group-specific protein n=1 Tax=Bacillus manliponensis TaxID=574376 RepID=A0A073K7P2_9BACI|nr:hypothetical protein [Bacillus manliponensis]KEK18283.1 hypothetical protein BAMA_05740 [Bacillus manliponensis]